MIFLSLSYIKTVRKQNLTPGFAIKYFYFFIEHFYKLYAPLFVPPDLLCESLGYCLNNLIFIYLIYV